MDFEWFRFDNITAIAAAYAAAVYIILWLALIFWVIRDVRTRSRDPFLHLIALILVIFLSIPGLLIYHLIRPAKTFEQKYISALDEEALLQEMEKQNNCPGCGKAIKEDWMICPHCHTKLKKKCVQCGKLIELPWNVCPFCGETQQKPYTGNNQ